MRLPGPSEASKTLIFPEVRKDFSVYEIGDLIQLINLSDEAGQVNLSFAKIGETPQLCPECQMTIPAQGGLSLNFEQLEAFASNSEFTLLIESEVPILGSLLEISASGALDFSLAPGIPIGMDLQDVGSARSSAVLFKGVSSSAPPTIPISATSTPTSSATPSPTSTATATPSPSPELYLPLLIFRWN